MDESHRIPILTGQAPWHVAAALGSSQGCLPRIGAVGALSLYCYAPYYHYRIITSGVMLRTPWKDRALQFIRKGSRLLFLDFDGKQRRFCSKTGGVRCNVSTTGNSDHRVCSAVAWRQISHHKAERAICSDATRALNDAVRVHYKFFENGQSASLPVESHLRLSGRLCRVRRWTRLWHFGSRRLDHSQLLLRYLAANFSRSIRDNDPISGESPLDRSDLLSPSLCLLSKRQWT